MCSGSVDIAPIVAEEEAEEEEMPEPKMDITHVHVTTLDEVVSVSSKMHMIPRTRRK